MSSVVLVTDSTADIPVQTRERLNIAMVPLKVMFGEETYLDNVTLQPAEFYAKLTTSNVLPKSSQPSPNDFYETFKMLIEEGKSVVCVTLSSAFSGTYQSATIAKSMLDDDADVTVIDSRSASYGQGLIVVAAAELALNGASREEVIAEIARRREKLRLYFLVDTLEYLQKGGRIGKASAVLGTLLNIKPILSIGADGVIFPVEKARGQKRAMNRIAEIFEEDLKDSPVHMTIAVTPGYDSGSQEMTDILKSRLNVRSVLVTEIGPVIGTHAGPGTIGLFVSPVE